MKNKNRKVLFRIFAGAFIFLSMGIFSSSASAFSIVSNGQPKAEIVVAKDAHPGVKLAAEDLQTFIEKMSGAKLSIVDQPTSDASGQIYVGQNAFTDKLGYRLPVFKGSGYDIFVGKNYVVLAGADKFFPTERFARSDLEAYRAFMGDDYYMYHVSNGGDGYVDTLGVFLGDDIGAWHAVSALLERLGVRFYAPYGEDGTIVPEKKDIALEEGRETKEAAFERRLWYHFDPRDKEGQLWLRRLKTGSHVGALINHTTMNLVGGEEVREKHPDWFARDKDGNFLPAAKGNKGGIPRYTNPDFIRACINWASKMFDAYPTLDQLTVGAPDESKDEEAGYPLDYQEEQHYRKPGMSRQQAYVNVLWDFHVAIAKELKKTHPDKYLVWWTVYADAVPTNIDPKNTPDNILVRMEAVSPGNAYVKDHKLKTYLEIAKEKFAKFKPTSKSQQWEWWLDYWYKESPRYPEFFFHRLQEVRKEQVGFFNGFFMETMPVEQDAQGIRRQSEMPIRQLMMYVNSKLMWDPHLDLDALLDEYYHLWYGPAEKEMKAFYTFAEKVWMRQKSRSVSKVDGFVQPEDIDKYFELLDAAKAKTQEGSIYRKRVQALEDGYAGLKTLFADRFPKGEKLVTRALSNDVKADGDFSKYTGDWVVLKNADGSVVNDQNRTEFQMGVTQDKKHVLVAFRIHEENPDEVIAKATSFDQGKIFTDDHVQVDLNTPLRNGFAVAVNTLGATYDKTTDLDLINEYALQEFWTPGVRSHVVKKKEGWEIELDIPTTDFGDMGPTEDQPWGVNMSRVRFAGGKKEVQSIGSETPSSWLQWTSKK